MLCLDRRRRFHKLEKSHSLMKPDDKDWHCFTLSQYDRHSGKREMEKAPVYHIID